MIILNILGWNHFVQLDHIRKLPLSEQLRQYNYYLLEQQSLQMQMSVQQVGSGGNVSNVNAAACIDFVADTTNGGTTFELTLNTVSSTSVNVETNWGDGSTTQTAINGTGIISHTFPSLNEVYNVRMCFDNANNVAELIFTGIV